MSKQYFTRPNVQPVITYIGTTPEQRQMSTDEFKAKFDEMTVNLQNYIKETLLTELDAFKQEFMTHVAESATKVIEEYGGNSTNGYYIKWGNGLTLCLKKVTVNQNIGGSGSAFTTSLPTSLTGSRVRFGGFSPVEPGTAHGNISNLGNVVASVSTTQWSLRSAETTCVLNQELILFAVSF